MVAPVDVARVLLWGRMVGAVAWDASRAVATFEFDPDWLDLGLDIAPLMMPLREARRGRTRFQFPHLPREAFHGLPGLLADALPDRFGQALINAWLAGQGRDPASFNPVERLCTIGHRGMGALNFEPGLRTGLDRSVPVEIAALVDLAQSVLSERAGLRANLAADSHDALQEIIRVGTSAGGARPKAVLAINDTTGEVRSGQVDAPPGFAPWLLKFDGVADNDLGDPQGFGRIEYAYYLMARAAGLEMMESRLLEENDRAHFLTRRFDRGPDGKRQHLQSLCALAHLDYNMAGSHAYEQAFQVMRALRLDYPAAEQMFRRAVFNIVARNQDDHTKNIAFLMDDDGRWSLSPAYDVTWAYNPQGAWTSAHQMTFHGKRDGFTRADITAVGREMSIRRPDRVLAEITDTVRRWPEFAAEAGVPADRARQIAATHRLELEPN
ncbi:toxin HipA [bacterium DOLJORAL78_65_58]|nr:MAG: toxin HipA [bacterium DOLZORAL124_64_63]PIE76176.1 MAG: toxin HipA [bacterium DOLJORAL78_65_58]